MKSQLDGCKVLKDKKVLNNQKNLRFFQNICKTLLKYFIFRNNNSFFTELIQHNDNLQLLD